MLSTYTQLREVFGEGISALDKYAEILKENPKIIEDKKEFIGSDREIEIFELQNQSQLSDLLIIRDINIKKTEILRIFLDNYIDKWNLNKLLSIRIYLNDDMTQIKVIPLKINIVGLESKLNFNKPINIKINFKHPYKKGLIKVINIKMNLKDLIMKGIIS